MNLNMAQGVEAMNMNVAQRHNDSLQPGAVESVWLGRLRVVLVDDYGYRPS